MPRRIRILADEATPRERRWLDRLEKTCFSRRHLFLYGGNVLKRLNPHAKTPRYGSYGGIGMEWVKKEVVKCERRKAREDKKDAEINVGVFI
jgi:hypothetical protein